MFMTLCMRLQAVQLVLPFVVEAVVGDACWHEFSHYERLSSIRGVVLLLCWCTVIYDVVCLGGGVPSRLYKWQYVLITAFSSCFFIAAALNA